MIIELYPATERVVAFTTLRGIAPSDCASPYSGVSLCDYTGDDEARISAALEHVRSDLVALSGLPADPTVLWARQRHTTRVFTVDRASATRSDIPDGVDALVCTVPGVVIGVHTADCVPVLIYDDAARIVAAVHSGWRGTVAGIIPAAVSAMCGLGASPDALCAVVGPAICADCYEVGRDVAAQFPAEAVSLIGAREHVDLVAAVSRQLLDCGLREQNLLLSGRCTRCEPQRYFSARRLGVASGRTFTGIMLR